VSLGFLHRTSTLSDIHNCGHDRLHVHLKGLPNVVCMCSSSDFTFDFGVRAGAAMLGKMWTVLFGLEILMLLAKLVQSFATYYS
jgi:hypothetical protein